MNIDPLRYRVGERDCKIVLPCLEQRAVDFAVLSVFRAYAFMIHRKVLIMHHKNDMHLLYEKSGSLGRLLPMCDAYAPWNADRNRYGRMYYECHYSNLYQCRIHCAQKQLRYGTFATGNMS